MPRHIDAHDPVIRALDSLRVGFQVIGFDWRYLYLNPAAAAHGRQRASDLIGRTMMEVYPGIEETPIFELLASAMVERTSHTVDNLFTFPDGESRWFDLRIEPTPEGICVYSADIHDRKLRELRHEAAHRERALAKPLLRRWWRRLWQGPV